MNQLKAIGKLGEKIALDYLTEKNYTIVETNFTSHWGEIDIIATKDNKLTFFEVKTRTSDGKGKPHEAIHYTKMKHLMRSVSHYLLKNKYNGYKLSIDAISIILEEDNTLGMIKHYENLDVSPFIN